MVKVRSGGCLCGFVRFEATGEPGNPHSCSCDICQRHSGASSLAWVEFPSEAVSLDGRGRYTFGVPVLRLFQPGFLRDLRQHAWRHRRCADCRPRFRFLR